MHPVVYIINDNYNVAYTFRPEVYIGKRFYILTLPNKICINAKYWVFFYKSKCYIQKLVRIKSEYITIRDRNLRNWDVDTEFQRMEILREICKTP